MHTATHRLPARGRAQLIASDVSVMRGATPVLNHVDLTLTPVSRVAIVGENGRGKSTLLHVLAGTLAPDSGTVQRIGTIGVAEQEMDASDQRTVGEAVADAIAEPLAALARLDVASHALADGTDDQRVLRTLMDAGVTVHRFDATTASMEQVFLSIYGHAPEEASA